MEVQKMKEWIDNANYEELLKRWRFGLPGDPFIIGEVWDYYVKRMGEKYNEIGIEEHVRISKKLDGGLNGTNYPTDH